MVVSCQIKNFKCKWKYFKLNFNRIKNGIVVPMKGVLKIIISSYFFNFIWKQLIKKSFSPRKMYSLLIILPHPMGWYDLLHKTQKFWAYIVYCEILQGMTRNLI